MFSFVFHDSKNNSWLAARDHFGIKPLYYAQCGSDLVFASEIKAILEHPEIRAQRDEHSLQQYITFQFCLDNRTLLRILKKLNQDIILQEKVLKLIKNFLLESNYEVDTIIIKIGKLNYNTC